MENKTYPALIKLDCEGAELKILESSKPILERDDVDFIIEIMINDIDKHDIFSLMTSHGFSGYLISNGGLIAENRPLTLPYHNKNNRTCWKNHFFTKKPKSEIEKLSQDIYQRWI